jgi:hypothetical protein
MDIHLDTLLGFPDVTVESCTQELGNVFSRLTKEIQGERRFIKQA